MVRAAIYMKNGDEEIKKEIKGCDLIASIGLEYKENGIGVHVAVQGEGNSLTARALARGMLNVLVRGLGEDDRDNAKKAADIISFRDEFDKTAKDVVYGLLLDTAENAKEEEGDEDGEIQV